MTKVQRIVYKEIEMYCNLTEGHLVEDVTDPLEWWKNNNTAIPHLAIMAAKYLCIPVTSASSERTVSTGRLVVQEKCSKMKCDIVSDSVLLNRCSKDVQAITSSEQFQSKRKRKIAESQASSTIPSDGVIAVDINEIDPFINMLRRKLFRIN